MIKSNEPDGVYLRQMRATREEARTGWFELPLILLMGRKAKWIEALISLESEGAAS
jgi:hypothetical protein